MADCFDCGKKLGDAEIVAGLCRPCEKQWHWDPPNPTKEEIRKWRAKDVVD